jgi:hypothetical protein
MEAIRYFEKVKSNQLLINLPNDFKEDFVEIIILPIANDILKSESFDNKEFQQKLMEAPDMNDEEYNEFIEKKNSFNQWKQ